MSAVIYTHADYQAAIDAAEDWGATIEFAQNSTVPTNPALLVLHAAKLYIYLQGISQDDSHLRECLSHAFRDFE
jgi:hypothetical protein